MIIAENNSYISKKELKIINFYSDGCNPCHAFMTNFIDAEETFGNKFDFIVVNTLNNIELCKKFNIMGTPTIIIIKNNQIIFNQSGIPNGKYLKKLMFEL